jgi:hypothetical protein
VKDVTNSAYPVTKNIKISTNFTEADYKTITINDFSYSS